MQLRNYRVSCDDLSDTDTVLVGDGLTFRPFMWPLVAGICAGAVCWIIAAVLLSCTGWGGLCFRVGFFVGIVGVGWSFPAHRNTLYASLGRCVERGYRQAISQALFEHVTNTSGLALCLQA